MDNEIFENKLKELGLSKRDFSNLTKLNYVSVAGWKQKGKTPEWVESYLEFYELAQKYKAIVANLPK
nr:hypothetical protein [uncultured Campylobacter sp.]